METCRLIYLNKVSIFRLGDLANGEQRKEALVQAEYYLETSRKSMQGPLFSSLPTKKKIAWTPLHSLKKV